MTATPPGARPASGPGATLVGGAPAAPGAPLPPPTPLPASGSGDAGHGTGSRTADGGGFRQRLTRLVGTGSEPGRLRLAIVLLVVLAALFGAVTAWSVNQRENSAGDVVEHSAPLSADAAEIYRSLADADATAAAGFLFAGQEPAGVRTTYTKDIATAGKLLARAAANAGNSREARKRIETINRELPVYTGLVETARANNRQGKPVGGAYIRYASDRMRTTILPAAEKLYTAETERMARDRDAAASVPWLAYAAGLLALGAVAYLSYLLYLSTNRVLNVGLLGAGAAVFVTLLWLGVGQTLSRSSLQESQDQGAASVRMLNEARIAALKARGDENLALIARGNGAQYVADFAKWVKVLDDKGNKGEGLMRSALDQAEDAGGKDPVKAAWKELNIWRDLHGQAREDDDTGEYDKALARTIGGEIDGEKVGKTTEKSFLAMDEKLAEAVDYEQQQFRESAEGGRNALTGLAVGGAVLCVLAAGAAAAGVNRRLAEYR